MSFLKGLVYLAVLATAVALSFPPSAFAQAQVRPMPNPGPAVFTPPIIIQSNSLNPDQLTIRTLGPTSALPSPGLTIPSPPPAPPPARRVVIYKDQHNDIKTIVIPPPGREETLHGHLIECEKECLRLCGNDDPSCPSICKDGCD